MILKKLSLKLLTVNLDYLPERKLLINTINAHSYNVAKRDSQFLDALINSDVILPDGIGVVLGYRLINKKIKKIAGADLFYYEMKRLQKSKGSCFFMGSSEATLLKIRDRISKEFPAVQFQTYSPPYKAIFSKTENEAMIQAVNNFQPDVLFIGMTAPKQEKWAYEHFNALEAKHVCCIGAVFDFYAGTVNRPPQWMINIGLEWFGRFINEPKRMWHRYLVSSPVIIKDVLLYRLNGGSI
jgi:N-acetylglucosaminyldiphosphoundecaprenol N-acetyl-beta-D-mannosaminyltransferase